MLKEKFSRLQKDFNICKNENIILSKENEKLKDYDFSKEIVTLKKKITILIDDLSTFTLGHDNLVSLVGNNRYVYDKSGLGHDEENESQSNDVSSDITFILSASIPSNQKSFTINFKLEQISERPSYTKKVPFKPNTNKQGPKSIWVP